MSREYDALLVALSEPRFPSGDPPEVARDELNAAHDDAVAKDVRVEWTELGGVRCADVAARIPCATE